MSTDVNKYEDPHNSLGNSKYKAGGLLDMKLLTSIW